MPKYEVGAPVRYPYEQRRVILERKWKISDYFDPSWLYRLDGYEGWVAEECLARVNRTNEALTSGSSVPAPTRIGSDQADEATSPPAEDRKSRGATLEDEARASAFILGMNSHGARFLERLVALMTEARADERRRCSETPISRDLWVVVWEPPINKGTVCRVFDDEEKAVRFFRGQESNGWPMNAKLVRHDARIWDDYQDEAMPTGSEGGQG